MERSLNWEHLFRMTKYPLFHDRGKDLPLGQVAAGHARAKTQDEYILSVFKRLPSGTELSATYFLECDGGFAMLQTSVRRSLTNLSKRGLIERCGSVLGHHGVNIGLYKLKVNSILVPQSNS